MVKGKTCYPYMSYHVHNLAPNWQNDRIDSIDNGDKHNNKLAKIEMKKTKFTKELIRKKRQLPPKINYDLNGESFLKLIQISDCWRKLRKKRKGNVSRFCLI